MPYRLAMAQKPYYAKRVPQNAGLLRCFTMKGGYRDSNPGPPEPQSGALTSCAIPTISGQESVRDEPEGIRTPDPRLRRPLLYPAELQTRMMYQPLHTAERVMGIEPTYPAWKAGVLPLNYTRMYISRGDRIRTCDPLVPNQVL